ncbi:MAG: mannose-1-phosphate guanylyltransferase [Planctomycetia bacterium]|nr:MAG: mannose-1-phosphate guanylyltransferase [Planctomycetia bacterium]
MRHAVIMAGGAGTRLWPLSRRQRPKQFMRLFEGASLLQLARRRLERCFDPAQTWVITSAAYVDLVAAELPDIPRKNLIGEPMGRDTANAVGLAAALIAERDPDATMAVFTADHILTPQDAFESALRSGLSAAEAHPTSLVTFGVTPTAAHTGYGYVRMGPPVSPGVRRCAGFREKPTLEVAQQYLASGEYLWNSGMFAWRVSAILAELAAHLPENSATLRDIARRWDTINGTDALAAAFGGLRKISVDFGVMERAADVLIVEMSCHWLDVGSWGAIASQHAPDSDGNVCIGASGLSVAGGDNILVSESGHLIATLGVSGLIVVQSADATLICRREDEQLIRELTAESGKRFGDRYA